MSPYDLSYFRITYQPRETGQTGSTNNGSNRRPARDRMLYLPMRAWATDDLQGIACPRPPTEDNVRSLIYVPDLAIGGLEGEGGPKGAHVRRRI